MIHYTKFKPVKPKVYNVKRHSYDDNIFTFDIETISLFEIDGVYKPFDYTRSPEYYREHDKACIPYIWQFGVNDIVYYGREFMDFETILKNISNSDIARFVYVHNLSYEMQFLLDIIEKNNWTISELCARNLRQPIQFKIEELNIYFRCSYMLTNLSLEKSAEKYTNIKKAVGELDYNINYSPLSKLPTKALHYAEMDIKVLYEIIKTFVNEYGHLKCVPLTQTGEVRYALKQEVDFNYIRRQWRLVPPEHIYCALMMAFQGGVTHANILYSNRVIHDVWSYDFCSSYPYALTCFRYPSEPFFIIANSQIDEYKNTHCLLYDITLIDVEAKIYNHYLSYSKLVEVNGATATTKSKSRVIVDNGRLVKCKSCRLICTDYDLECIKMSYTCTVKINHVWASYADYLDKRVISFILTRYRDKTTLKGITDKYDFYMKMKQQLNSVFGMACTNPLKTGIEFDIVNGWTSHDLQDMVTDNDGERIRFIDKKLKDMKKSYSTLFFYAVGVWCTAISRWNLWRNVVKLDKQVAYYDTDSIKGVGDVTAVIDEYNNEVMERLKESSEHNGLPLDWYMPKDVNGNIHPLGVFENETEKELYKSFKTLGAKKYIVETTDGTLHMTVSGVRKKAVSALKSIDDFQDGFVFDYKSADKLTHTYIDNQPSITYIDADGNRYTSTQRHSIVLQPTTYTLGVTDEYETLINQYIGILNDNI